MDNTILYDVKTSIGINPDVPDETFDNSIIMKINAAISELSELGVGDQGFFVLRDKSDTWRMYLGEEYEYILSLVKSYVCTYVRQTWDTSQNGTILNSLDQERQRLEFRIMTAIEQHNRE